MTFQELAQATELAKRHADMHKLLQTPLEEHPNVLNIGKTPYRIAEIPLTTTVAREIISGEIKRIEEELASLGVEAPPA